MGKKKALKQTVPATTGVSWVVWTLLAVSLAVGISVVLARRSGTRTATVQANHLASDVQKPADEYATWRAQYLEMIASVVGDDVEAQDLSRFFRQHAVFGKMRGIRHFLFERPQFTPPSPASRERQDFAVVVCTKQECAQNGVPRESNWLYDVSNNIMFVPPPHLFSRQAGGSSLLHETMHAFDLLSGREPMGLARTSPEFSTGEVRAHSLEIRLYERISGQRYRQALQDALRQCTVRTDAGWIQKDDTPMRLLEMIDALLPPAQSADETNSRFGRHYYALNFLLAEESGRGFAGKVQFIQWRFSQMDDGI